MLLRNVEYGLGSKDLQSSIQLFQVFVEYVASRSDDDDDDDDTQHAAVSNLNVPSR